MYKTAAEASPIWMRGDPAEGQWHVYTGGWIATVISRDEADNFDYFYTPRGRPEPLWQAYKPSPSSTRFLSALLTTTSPPLRSAGSSSPKPLSSP
jgi:peptide/nickel transport system substrate-binding protein